MTRSFHRSFSPWATAQAMVASRSSEIARRAADIIVNGGIEVALVGDGAERDALSAVVNDTFVPSLVLAVGDGASDGGIALLRDRPAGGGRATAYVCRRSVCDEPTSDSARLGTQLRQAATQDGAATRNASAS